MDFKNRCSLPSVCYMVRYLTNRTRERKMQLNYLTDIFITYCSLFIIKSIDLGAVSEIMFVFSFSDSSFDGDTKCWSGWSVTCGDVLASLGTSELVVVKKESQTPSKESSAPKKTATRARGVFPCERCGRSYVRKDSLQRHLKYECGKEPTFQCPFCPQRCKRKAHQTRHIRRQHSDMINVVEPKGDSRIMDTSNE